MSIQKITIIFALFFSAPYFSAQSFWKDISQRYSEVMERISWGFGKGIMLFCKGYHKVWERISWGFGQDIMGIWKGYHDVLQRVWWGFRTDIFKFEQDIIRFWNGYHEVLERISWGFGKDIISFWMISWDFVNYIWWFWEDAFFSMGRGVHF